MREISGSSLTLLVPRLPVPYCPVSAVRANTEKRGRASGQHMWREVSSARLGARARFRCMVGNTPLQETHRSDLQVVVRSGFGVWQVVYIYNREQVWVLGAENKMCLMPASIFDPAVVLQHMWLYFSSCLDDLAIPGLEANSILGWELRRSLPPHRYVQAVDDDVLDCLGTQEVQEVHLDTPHTNLQLGHCDWPQAGLTSAGEVAGHLNGVGGAAQVWVDPVSAIVHPLLTVLEVPADPGWVVVGAQWVLEALDQVTEVVKGLKNLCSLVQHGEVHALVILCPECRVRVNEHLESSAKIVMLE